MENTRASECRPIIILGAERSGTSVVAEMVHEWGAYVGPPEELTPADEHNPRGYWEYKPIWDFLAEIGDFAEGISWWDASFQERVRKKADMPRYRENARTLIRPMEKEGKPWMWKDPALSFFLPFWREIWCDPIYIITVRNPYDTAHSWQKFVLPKEYWGRFDLVAGNLLRWQHIMSLVLENMEKIETKLFIPYEALMEDPEKYATRLNEFLNCHCATPISGETSVESIVRIVDSLLWRNRVGMPFPETHGVVEAQKRLYEFLLHKVEDPHAQFRLEDYPMPTGWRDIIKGDEAHRKDLLR